MNTKKQLENEIYDYLVPLSRFRRELNAWIRKIISKQSVVAITRNKKIVAYMIPHKGNIKV